MSAINKLLTIVKEVYDVDMRPQIPGQSSDSSRLTEGNPSVSQGVNNLTGNDSLDVLSSSTHGVADCVEGNCQSQSVRPGPDVSQLERGHAIMLSVMEAHYNLEQTTTYLGDKWRCDTCDDPIDNANRSNDGMLSKGRCSELRICKWYILVSHYPVVY